MTSPENANGITGIIYSMIMRRPQVIFFVFGLSLIFLTACKNGSPTSLGTTAAVRLTETAIGSPEPSQTPVPPTSTPVPLAAIVNGETITLAEYQAELSRFQASSTITGTNLASEAGTVVLDELIDQTLLAQSAAQNGYIVDDMVLQSRIDALETDLGGSQALEDWKTLYGYSDTDFQKALRRAVGAAWMRDQIITAVPETADQVHVLQILLPTASDAEQAYSKLQSGTDFQDLAATYDPETGDDLGWFPRDYLGEPAIDETVFALQPNQYSQVVETEIGFHIFYLAERDPNHALLPDARYTLQAEAIGNWLDEQRSQSEIKILLP